MGAVLTSINVHVHPDTDLSFRSYPDGNRVTVHLGEMPKDVALFLDADGIDRLAALLARARESLNVAVVKAAA